MHAAAEAAGADGVIAALPHGLDTAPARSWWGGRDLSGGQWQRAAVARAFHRDAPVLVMDGPAAVLDAGAERRIYTRLKALAAGWARSSPPTVWPTPASPTASLSSTRATCPRWARTRS
ncbi:hypothetical protein [Streptomyces aureus]|uniref:ABC transporter domain-containing protein n=1 Tax=Streptomyces aureus TaxID=193461 RepID=A0ABV4SHL8_9ACTN